MLELHPALEIEQVLFRIAAREVRFTPYQFSDRIPGFIVFAQMPQRSSKMCVRPILAVGNA